MNFILYMSIIIIINLNTIIYKKLNIVNCLFIIFIRPKMYLKTLILFIIINIKIQNFSGNLICLKY